MFYTYCMIQRPGYLKRIEDVFRIHPVAALLGPRQCGKTTLARMLAEFRASTIFDLENPVGRRQLNAHDCIGAPSGACNYR